MRDTSVAGPAPGCPRVTSRGSMARIFGRTAGEAAGTSVLAAATGARPIRRIPLNFISRDLPTCRAIIIKNLTIPENGGAPNGFAQARPRVGPPAHLLCVLAAAVLLLQHRYHAVHASKDIASAGLVVGRSDHVGSQQLQALP